MAGGSDAALSIDSATGAVTLTADSDHETQSQYSFAVIATDAAGNASEAQSVTLDINDLDDAAPTVTSGDTASAIDENSGASQVIYTAIADDSADDIAATPIAYSLAEGSDAALSINTATGEVTLATDPDHETQSEYSFSVIATDAAGNTSEAQAVTLDINNLDEVAPTITSDATAMAIDENSGAGQIIYTAAADDSADVSNTPIAYSLAVGSDSALTIDASTGAVTLTADPDYETQSLYSFGVIATDAAGNASAAQSVTLDINNLDEAAPTIISAETASVVESKEIGSVVYQTQVDDSADISAGISFTLSGDSDTALTIDAETGAVTLNEDPIYNPDGDLNTYIFTVIADDSVYQAQKEVTLTVIDADEELPVFNSPAAADVDENIGENQVIYTATTEDQSVVTYSLAEGYDEGLTINATTGQVSLDVSPDHETLVAYSFTVVATDSEGNVAEQSVTISINDLDEVAPAINSDATAAAIDENSGAGQVIYIATADDSSDISNGVTFSLSTDSDSALSIDASNGEVTLDVNPDFETQSQYSFTVLASDGINAGAQQTVTLDINNLDDASPIISSPVSESIDENVGASQVIYTAEADDSADASDGVTFSFVDTTEYSGSDAGSGSDTGSDTGPAESVISIPELAAATQHVYVSSSTRSEDGSQETVVVSYNADDTTTTGLGLRIHFDSSVLSASDIATLMTNDLLVNAVVESDDSDLDGDASTDTYVAFGWASLFGAWPGSAPADLASITFDIAEGATGSSAINFTISSKAAGFAFDGQNHQVAITAEAASDESSSDDSTSIESQLSFDSATGEVTLNIDPDYETQSAYSFEVVATDEAGNASEPQQVSVSVNNLDEIAPTITSGAPVLAIDENSGAVQVIYTATADDSADVSDDVVFSLSEDSDAGLTIDATTGEVTLTVDPDFETQSQYNFSVIATDAESNSSEAQSVTLDINNLDDTAPTITSVELVNIDENIGANQVVYTATADDSADVNDGFTFSLSEDSDSGLSIDTTSGAVTLATDPDHEAQSQYNFAVIATDAAGNVSEAQSVALVINNLDDTAPIITSVDLVNVDEGIGADQVVYTANADDSVDVSDGFTFSLAAGSDAALSINAATGEVILATDPDHETQSEYSFALIATDAAGNSSEAQSVILDINDLDDTAPIITSDTGVALLQTDSTVIYQVDADDIDSPDNEITYSLVPDTVSVSQVGAIEQVYTANEDGSITLQLFIDDSVTADYPDGLSNYDYVANFNTQEVTILSYELTASALNIVNDLVDGQLAVAQVYFPVNFDIESGYIAQIDFNLQPGVYSAEFEISNILLPNNLMPDNLEDTVDGVSSVVRYLGNNGLSIDSATGEVTVTDAPTFISQPFYNFTVTATDAAGNQSESQQVTVSVEDKLVITSGSSSVIDENSGANQVVYTATSNDEAGVSYSLEAGSDSCDKH